VSRDTPPRDAPPSSTLCVHAGERPDPATGAIDAPVHLSSAFAFDDAEQAAGAFRGENDHLIYGRWRNPTVSALEAKVAALEAGEDACATASGMAAISAVLLTLCETGDHVVAPRSIYGESARLMRERLPRLGITTTFVDQTDPEAYARAIETADAAGRKTRLLYVESPANPTLALTDVRAVAALARARGLLVVADNTFATPYGQRPLALGADLVVHSMTKQLGGHGDAIGGVVVGGRELVGRVRDAALKSFGGILSPLNAMLIARGMRTFSLRARQANQTAQALADALGRHPAVARVHYPGHASHPQHALARAQMSAFGALVAFELRGGLEAGKRVLERVRLVTHAVSLGDVRSLITHPASTTHSSMPREARLAGGVSDGLLRVACGIEETDDVVGDLLGAIGD
jgi:cystathionine beta-lyase/cystathionine gamma-synthase